MNIISMFLALINSLAACLLIALSLSAAELRQAEAWWSITRIMAAAGTVLVGVLTWLAAIRPIRPELLSLGSLFLVGIGAATTVWTWHLAFVSGDREYFLLVYGAGLIVQGIVSLLGLLQEPGTSTPV